MSLNHRFFRSEHKLWKYSIFIFSCALLKILLGFMLSYIHKGTSENVLRQ